MINNDFYYTESDLVFGLYLRAFCNGMDEALEPLRQEIIEIEQIVLNDSHTPVSMILCRLQKYLSLFGVFNSIISEVNTAIFICDLFSLARIGEFNLFPIYLRFIEFMKNLV